MDGHHGHAGIEGAVPEREVFCDGIDHRRATSRTLRSHHRRWFDGRHGEVTRFVRAGPGTDVDHRTAATEAGVDQRLDPRVGTAPNGVARSLGLVVEVACRSHPASGSMPTSLGSPCHGAKRSEPVVGPVVGQPAEIAVEHAPEEVLLGIGSHEQGHRRVQLVGVDRPEDLLGGAVRSISEHGRASP